MAASQDVQLTPTVRRLVDRDSARLADPTARLLDKNQRADLKTAIRLRIAPPGGLSLANAIAALTGVEQSAEVAEIVGGVLGDDAVSPIDRAVAAVGLRYLPAVHAQPILLEHLACRERHVRTEVVRSLGMLGDVEALTALRRLRPATGTHLHRQVLFSRSLIAHRLGSVDDSVPFQRGAKREPGAQGDMIPLRLRPKMKRTLAKDRARLRGTTYGIELAERGFGLQAGRARWTVFLNREIAQGGGWGRLFDRPWITALLAREDAQTKLSNVQYVVLTDPAPRSTEIGVFRSDGELFYSGRMTRKEGLFRFDMRDIDREGTAPTNVSGHLTPRGVELELVVPFGLRKNPRRPQAVIAPR